MAVQRLAGAGADVLFLKASQGHDFLALQMQCPSRIDRAMTRLRFAKSFIAFSTQSSSISVNDNTPASIVLIRPARLSRPSSIRRAELPVTSTWVVELSTRDFNCGAQSFRFLHFIEEQVRRFTLFCRRVQRILQNYALKPIHEP